MAAGVVRALKAVALSILVAAALSSCPSPMGDSDLREMIEKDVEVATAEDLVLTIAQTDYGVTSPSGKTEVKEGMPTLLTATPFPTHGLVGWTQTGGSGVAEFTQVADGIEVVLRGVVSGSEGGGQCNEDRRDQSHSQ